MQPSDSLVPLGRRSGRPSPTAYLGAETLSFPSRRCPRHPDATPETFLPRLPTRRLCPEERQGPPRCLGHPLRACRALRPRRVRRAPRPATGAPAVAFRSSETLSTRNAFNFGALPLTAHSLACLRFAQSVTVSGARLATGRAGSPLAGRVSHPLDDEQGFMVSSHTPILLDQPCLVAPKAGIHTALTEDERVVAGTGVEIPCVTAGAGSLTVARFRGNDGNGRPACANTPKVPSWTAGAGSLTVDGFRASDGPCDDGAKSAKSPPSRRLLALGRPTCADIHGRGRPTRSARDARMHENCSGGWHPCPDRFTASRWSI